MTYLLRRALRRHSLESELIHPDAAPEEDDMMLLFQKHYPEHFGGTTYSLEERADGKAGDEFEHTIYARLGDPGQLSQAKSMEHHSQWEIRIDKSDKNAGKGSMRVRKTWIDGGSPDFVAVMKIPMDLQNNAKKKEIPIPATEDWFVAFQFLSPQGMVKDRYHFPIVGTDLVWEIDCYPKEGGGYHEWVKIDLEVKDLSAPLPEFPIHLEDVILPVGVGKLSKEEHDELVSKLYDECFLSPNPFLSGAIRKQVEQGSVNLGDGEADANSKPEGGEQQAAQPDQTEAESEEGGTKDTEQVEDTSKESSGDSEQDDGASGEPSGGGL